MRYGNFSHVVFNLTSGPDGKKNDATIDEFVDAFDPKTFAGQMKTMGVEYVIFTAWHKGIYNLGPNKALDRWLPGHTAKRDLIGEVADALNEQGIRLIIYAHPNDGHDLKPEEQKLVGFEKPAQREKVVSKVQPKYDDFINEIYADLVTRYAKKPNLLGFWWDTWPGNNGAIDPVRLRKTVLDAMPGAIVLSNNESPDWIDYMSHEKYYMKGPRGEIDDMLTMEDNQSTILTARWWFASPHNNSKYSPEALFQFTVLNACTGAPGGMAWAVSPASDGKTWGGDIMETMLTVNRLLDPIRPTLCGVATSLNWPVKTLTRFSGSPGYGATRSLDGTKEYLHVLRPPEGKSLEVALPVERLKSARLFRNGHAVKLETTDSALRLTLDPADTWDPLDTVITLERDPATPTSIIPHTHP